MTRFRIRDERGNTALYTLFLLPISLFFSAIAVDVSGWNALRDKLQEEADSLAIQALGALPNQDRVRSRVASAAAELHRSGVEAEVFFPTPASSAVGVALRARYRSSFDFLIGAKLKQAFHVRRSGVAQVVPGDYVLIVSDGGTLRPRLEPSSLPGSYSFSPWGDALEWPASRYFECVRPPFLAEPNALGWSWWKDWGKAEFRRWATQSCFNPVLSPLKRAAIGLAEGVMAHDVNRLALIFTPGESSSRGFRTARHVHGENESATLYRNQTGGFSSSGTRLAASWGNYLELERFLGDEICMLLTRPEASLSPVYELPATPRSDAATVCAEPLAAPPCGGLHAASGHFAECYISASLTVRDAIYWNAAKLPIPGFPAQADIAAALREAWFELTDERVFAAEKTVRGNLARNALRHVFVLTDTLPPLVPELTALLTAFRSRGIQLTLVALFHEGLRPDEAGELRDRISEWESISQNRNYSVRVFTAESPDELEASVAPTLRGRVFQYALRS